MDFKKGHIKILIFAFAFVLIFNSNLPAADIEETIDEHGNLRIYNEYIAIVSNTEENARSRFAVETTGGDPGREGDQDMPLIYGRPVPWTSYTTFRIDGENYVYGGETERRAGREANYGEKLMSPEVEEGSIVSRYRLNELEIEQNLEIVQSTTTGLYDTARIEYTITNTSDEPIDLGARIMLDTMLGEVDGSPFRVEEEAITTDTRKTEEELPAFYQSFDKLTDPQITSQGGFIGENIDTPDRVYMSNWGSLADGPWDFNFEPGREFLREGEFEIDSAIALYWDPDTIQPGETRSYATTYGLGGISMVPGMLSLGISAPTEFSFSATTPELPVVAYIENTTELTAENVTVNIDLPEFLQAEEPTRDIGDLEAGEVAQINYYATALQDDLPESMSFEITAEADNTDANLAEREINLIAPAQLEADFYPLEEFHVENGRLKPVPFTLRAELENVGEVAFQDFKGELIIPPGIDLAKYEKDTKQSQFIEPGEELTIDWRVVPLEVEGNFPFALQITGQGNFSETKRTNIEIPDTNPAMFLNTYSSKDETQIITVEARAEKFNEDIENINFKIQYDRDVFQHIYSTRGTMFVRDGRLMAWNGPVENTDANTEAYVSFEEQLPDNVNRGGLAILRFKADEELDDLSDYKDHFEIIEATAYNQDGQEINIEIIN